MGIEHDMGGGRPGGQVLYVRSKRGTYRIGHCTATPHETLEIHPNTTIIPSTKQLDSVTLGKTLSASIVPQLIDGPRGRGPRGRCAINRGPARNGLASLLWGSMPCLYNEMTLCRVGGSSEYRKKDDRGEISTNL